MCEITEQQHNMESNTREISHGGVFYSCVHDSCKAIAITIFNWLGLTFKPEVLKPGSNNVGAILILQHDRGRESDDISAIQNEYGQYLDKQIIVISLTTHDAEDHTNKFCIEDTLPAGNIMLLKIHQRTNGYIHECKGNHASKDLVQSIFGITKQMDFQRGFQNIAECDTLLTSLHQFANTVRPSSNMKHHPLDEDNSVSDWQSMNMKSTKNAGITGSSSALSWISDKYYSWKESSRYNTSRGVCESHFDQDTTYILQKIKELIQCLEKWKDKQSSNKVELDQLEVLKPKGCKQEAKETAN